MTLLQVIKQLQKIALRQHNVRYVGEGDIYRDLNAQPSIKYDAFYITQNQHQSQGEFDRYSFNLFYVSRLEDEDAGNALQIQSIGKEIIDNVVELFCQQFDADVYGVAYYQPFIQRFSDLTAGMYCIITLEVAKDTICPDE